MSIKICFNNFCPQPNKRHWVHEKAHRFTSVLYLSSTSYEVDSLPSLQENILRNKNYSITSTNGSSHLQNHDQTLTISWIHPQPALPSNIMGPEMFIYPLHPMGPSLCRCCRGPSHWSTQSLALHSSLPLLSSCRSSQDREKGRWHVCVPRCKWRGRRWIHPCYC